MLEVNNEPAFDPYMAYYDASGSEGQHNEPLVVCGVLARQSQWLAFDKEWTAVLTSYGVSTMHTTDFLHRKGVYAEFPKDKTVPLVDALLAVAEEFVEHAVTIRVVPDDYHTVNKKYDLSYRVTDDDTGASIGVWDGPYAFATLTATSLIEQHVHSSPGEPQTQHLLEKGDAGQEILSELGPLVRGILKVISRRTDDGGYVTPFEVADMIGYVRRRATKEWLKDGTPPRHKLWSKVKLSVPTESYYLDEGKLGKLAEQQPDKFPRRGGTSTEIEAVED